MADLYGSLDADRSRTEATRQASRRITAHVRGWTEGVRVVATMPGPRFEVWTTSGSNGGRRDVLLGSVERGLWLAEGGRMDDNTPMEEERLVLLVQGEGFSDGGLSNTGAAVEEYIRANFAEEHRLRIGWGRTTEQAEQMIEHYEGAGAVSEEALPA